MNTYCIIGAKGMLGTMLSQIFADQNPILLDRDEIDITDETSVRSKLIEIKPTVIINAAAYTNVDGAETDKETAFQVNEKGIENLANVARELGATVVHYSTDYVFPGDKEEGYTEEDESSGPLNVYGESKLAGEKALQHAPNHYLIRTAWLYGPNGKNFVTTMLGLAKEKDSLSVVNDQIGSPTFTKDLAQYTRTLLEEEYPFGTYHGVNDGRTSWYEFAKKIFEIADVNIEVKPVTSAEFVRPAKRPSFSILQNTKGPKMRSWTEALQEYIQSM